MKVVKIKDILGICNGNLIFGNEEEILDNFSNDTRNIKKGDTFVGIKGDNFDGNSLYKDAIEKGAKTCILQDIQVDEKYVNEKNVNIIIVDDTIKAIGLIANYKRKLYGNDFPVVAVTGSVGKTSTKDIVASVLSQKYNVLKTEGNFNNHIGLPLTILKLKDHTALVVEMGMNHFGEIEYLTNIAEPNIAVITNIGTSHIGNLGSRENILKAKLEILKSGKIEHLVLNNDNDLLHTVDFKLLKELCGDEYNNLKIHTFGINNSSDFIGEKINLNQDGSDFECVYDNQSIKVTVPVGGQHFVYNALCAFTVGNILNIDKKSIIDGIQNFELTKRRMEIIHLKNDITVINDAYNASYDSMKASLEFLKAIDGKRKIAVLGDMLELGEYSKELHEKVGYEVAKNGIDILVTVGKEAKYISSKAKENNSKIYNECFKINSDAVNYLIDNLKNGDVILLKASNGMKFSEILDNIIKKIG